MAQDKDQTAKKLSALWSDPKVPVLSTRGHKYVIISDTHLGDGGEADDFRENEQALVRALEYYHRKNYTLILLGDVEEFWQFDLEKIEKRYRDSIYARIKAFGDNRVYRIFGNHDSEWGTPADPTKNNHIQQPAAWEALKMRDASDQVSLLLVHGHQGSPDADKYSWFSRFVVRGLFKPVESLAKWAGLYGHSSATKSQITKEYESIFYGWAKANKTLLICGHSHRAIFAAQSRADELQEQIEGIQAGILTNRGAGDALKTEIKKIEKLRQELANERDKGRDFAPLETNGQVLPCYFNSGCALYTDGLTTIEIADDVIKLVKWHKQAEQEPPAVVFKEGSLSNFIRRVKGHEI